MKRVSNKIIESFSNEGTCSLGEVGNVCNIDDHCKKGLHCKNKKCKQNEYIYENGTAKTPLDSDGSKQNLIDARGDLNWCVSCDSK